MIQAQTSFDSSLETIWKVDPRKKNEISISAK